MIYFHKKSATHLCVLTEIMQEEEGAGAVHSLIAQLNLGISGGDLDDLSL